MGVFDFLTQEIAIDLGTANTLIIHNDTVVVDEPSIVAIDRMTGKVIAVSRNIQRRKLVEEQQKLTEQQLKEANITKDKFFSIIAHDLKNPIHSIHSLISYIAMDHTEMEPEDLKYNLNH